MNRPIALCLLVPLAALGDPGPATRYLMNEPATMLDVGLLRAEPALAKYDRITTNSVADYWATEDGVEVRSSFGYLSADDKLQLRIEAFYVDSPRERCGFLLREYGMFIAGRLESWFSHAYYGPQYPRNLWDALAARVELHCQAGSGGLLTVHGKRMLAGDQVFWTESDDE